MPTFFREVNYFLLEIISMNYILFQRVASISHRYKVHTNLFKEHKEAQRTIRGILISTDDLHIKFQVKNN
jgi:hypothetical protein